MLCVLHEGVQEIEIREGGFQQGTQKMERKG